ncbi:2-polyprenylphenol 6-hydroxylase [Microvirga flavescens]|uniref:2-polyprenylphenol 6-hydroxylase n=1 Tax=Microvirga flavescens TaxID=2249811 RepID=UPI000DD7DDBF|nr:2-polyprenylphenol 6-hydroxylase [Microvirga flavescens]
MVSIVHLARNLRAGFVLAREGALALVDPNALPPSARFALRVARIVERRNIGDGAARLSAALTRLGPSYVKFGQFLATRPDIVGAQAARDLEQLQDRMPPFPRDEAVKTVEAALGRSIGTLFLDFSEPLAAASIAQVHKARIKTPEGEETVAVKVVRPGVREGFARDLQAMRAAAKTLERFMPEARRFKAQEVVETLARSVAVEMDLRLEAAAMSELAENTKDDHDFIVPKPEWDLTARDVLTTTWIDGIRLNDLAAIDAAGFDRVSLARTLIQSFLRHAIRDGFFHADMHPGNLFIDAKGRLVAVDFGIMGRLGMKERLFLAEILLGFIQRDYRRVAEVHFEAGYVPPHHSVEDFAQALRAIGEPIHDRRADEISMAKLLTLLFEITALFDMATRTELVMLQKTMVVVEGVARNLDPKLDMWGTADPVVRGWIERHFGPLGRIEEAGKGVRTLAHVAADLPAMAVKTKALLDRVEEMTRDGVRLDAQSIAAIGRAEAQGNRWGNAALWFVVVLLMILVFGVL